MKSQANRNYVSNDDIMTPDYLAKDLVNHFKPKGIVLEPCKGTGNILRYLSKDALWCEIKEGKDFLEFEGKVNWVITNPPWSKIRIFLQKSLKVADNIVFLLTINHLWTKARLKDIFEAGFGLKEIYIFDTPNNFPQMGFQVGAIHLKKGYKGDIKFTKEILQKKNNE